MVGASNGLVLFYEIDKSQQINHVQSFQVSMDQEIRSISVNRTSSVISCISKNAQTQNHHFDLVKTSMFDSEESPVTNFFGDGNHS
jgi:hypothetical protein